MTDWAYELAEKLLYDVENHPDTAEVAKALRKAKAEGLREAAQFVRSGPTGGAREWTAREIEIHADKIENGDNS